MQSILSFICSTTIQYSTARSFVFLGERFFLERSAMWVRMYLYSFNDFLALLASKNMVLIILTTIQPALGKLSSITFYYPHDILCTLAEIQGTVQWTCIKRETVATNLDWKLKCNLRNINNRKVLKTEFWF